MSLLDILFPKKCVGCRKTGTYFCADCIQTIKQTDLICPKCERLAIGGATHPVCKRKFGLDGLWFLGIYEGFLKKAIQKLKYKFVPEMAENLVDITLEYWVRYQPFLLDEIKKYPQSWVIIPVPLHQVRENWRGFNQSSAIGQVLSKRLGLAYSNNMKRTRYTKPQIKLKGKARRKNIFGAFALSDLSLLSSYPNILLIDDVWTTGSTLRECCYVLKRKGAKKVWALTLAR